jgi:hypothetical protein
LNSQTEKPLVITLHGIRTFAPWQKELADELGKAGFYTKSLQYGHYGIFGLLRKSQRRKKIEWLREQYTQITREYPDVVPSIIAHSFGTYMIANVLELYDGIQFDQVVLCGSVIPQDYNWQELVKRNQVKRVLNDCAEKDIVVKAAPFFIKDAGSSGAYGFKRDNDDHFHQRFIAKFGHSDYLHVLNFTTNWIPYLKGGKAPQNRPPLNREFNWKYAITTVLFLLLLSGLVLGGVKIAQLFTSQPDNKPADTNSNHNAPVKETASLQGIVIDQNDRPIQEVKITIDEMPGMKAVETSTDGVFSINGIPLKYGESVRLRGIKEGYLPNPYTEDFVLGKAPPRIKLTRKR